MYEVSQRFLDTVAGSHRAVVRVQVLPTDTMPQFGPNPVGGIELPLLDGDIKLTSTQDVNGTCDFTISGDYWELLQPYGAEIFVQRGIDFGDGTTELVPCGYYGIEEISQDKAPSGPVRVAGADRSRRLQRNRVVYPIEFPAGSTHKAIFDSLVNGVTPPGGEVANYPMFMDGDVPVTFADYDPNTTKIGTSLVCEDDAHAFLQKIADAKGCVLRFNRLGELVVQLRSVPPGAESVYTVRGGAGGNLIAASRKVTRDGVYNYVVARGSDPANPTGYRLAYNEDETSPLRWYGPFGVVVRYYASPLLLTNDAADAAAETVLSRYKGLPSSLGLLSVPNPALDPLDVIEARLGVTAATHLIDQVSIPLVGSQAVQIVTRTLNEVVVSDDDAGGGSGGFPNPPNPGGGGTGGGGTGGGGGGGTGGGGSVGTAIPDRVLVAQLILDRLNSGLSIFEDWTWPGAHPLVGQHNDPLLAEFEAAHPSASTLGTEARTWLADYVARGGVGSGGGTGTTRTAGPGGVPTPAGATLTTSDSSSQLTISSGGSATAPKVYDGQGHTVGRINVTASNVVVQNFYVNANSQYGILVDDVNNVTIQNCDIKNVRPTGDGDLNAMSVFGNNHKILYNTMIDFVGVDDPGGSHTDGIQTWISDSHPISSSNWEIIGNIMRGPLNPSRNNSVPSIHQCIMQEGPGRGGNSGGSGTTPSNWLILDNEFKGSWNQEIKLDGISGVKIARNKFTGESNKVIDDHGGVTFYSDNVISGDYGSTGITVTSGAGPANPYAGTGTGGGGGGSTSPGPATMTAKEQAALLILSRLSSSLPIFEDWSWAGAPTIVDQNNDTLLAEFQAAHPSGTSTLGAEARTWLANYAGTTTPGPGGGAGTGAGVPVGSTTLFTDGFESGNFSKWSRIQNARADTPNTASYVPNTYHLQIVNDSPAHPHAVRFEIRNGDEALGGERTEILGPSSTDVTEGDRIWVEFDVKHGTPWATPTADWCNVMQWHHDDEVSDGSPPLSFTVVNSDDLQTSGDGVPHTPRTIYHVQPGVWRHVIHEIKFSASASVGYVKAWVDGVQTLDDRRATMLQGADNYFKLGIYRPDEETSTSVIYYDNIRFSTGTPVTPGGGGTGGGGTGTTMPSILRMGKANGLTKMNLGVDYLPGQGPSGKEGTHVDHTLAEIENNLVIPGYADINGSAVRLTSYVGAAHTPNSSYSRTEFRELGTDGVAKAAWSSTSGEHYLWVRGKIIRLVAGRPHLVIAQIHDGSDDVGTIRVEGTNVVSTYGDSGRPGTLKTGLVLGTEYQWMLKTIRSGSNTIIQYFWDDMQTPKATQSYSGGSGNYFKFGAYGQASTEHDDQGESFVIDLLDSEVWHTGYPTPTARH